jgi:N-acetylmuramic acid 6-phosphate etherase
MVPCLPDEGVLVADLLALGTESPNARSADLDALRVDDLLAVMNAEDRRVPDAVTAQLGPIADAVAVAVDSLAAGGRLVYLGAGTRGRLGVLDAAECPPTFSTDPGQVVGVLAGGRGAMFEAVEGAEDDAALGARDLADLGLTDRDTVVGLAASGRTPYVVGGLDHARAVGASTVAIACNPDSEIGRHADVRIELDTGPEVLTGSTRLKAGTAQKLVLNMISTAAMVRLGKVYGNLMVDVRPSNAKLRERAVRIVREATGCDDAAARAALAEAGDHPKTAIVALLCGVDAGTARSRLTAAHGFVRAALPSAP